MGEVKRNYLIPDERIETVPLGDEYQTWCKENAWWHHENIKTPDRYVGEWPNTNPDAQEAHKQRWENFFKLHNILLSIGGEETCFADAYEEDMENILERGRFYNGTSKMMKGKPSRCHENTCNLWTVNREKHDVHIATGYALSQDGIWRQHSWLVQRYQTSTQHRTRIIETTCKRVAYFGFEMTEEEANEFCYHNYF